jgi:hypothetical protein
MTTKSIHALLEHLIDYAGLFPPAALSMEEAVRNYARYRDDEFAWALGKFIVPKERVDEVPRDFPLSILGIDEVKNLEEARDRAFVESFDIDEIKRRGLRAKIRMGGESVPSIGQVASFIHACKNAGVLFKATAGLHHPIRNDGAHGFINVFLAAAMTDHAEEIVREEDPHAFAFDDEGARWRDQKVSTHALMVMRNDFALSFGSCSFEEPINDLKDLGWL